MALVVTLTFKLLGGRGIPESKELDRLCLTAPWVFSGVFVLICTVFLAFANGFLLWGGRAVVPLLQH